MARFKIECSQAELDDLDERAATARKTRANYVRELLGFRESNYSARKTQLLEPHVLPQETADRPPRAVPATLTAPRGGINLAKPKGRKTVCPHGRQPHQYCKRGCDR